MRPLLVSMVVSAASAFAFDASIPDGSAGMGGSEMTSEENEMRDPCLSSRECDRGFSCTAGRCVPAPIKNASGCGGGIAMSVLPFTALALTLARRRRRS